LILERRVFPSGAKLERGPTFFLPGLKRMEFYQMLYLIYPRMFGDIQITRINTERNNFVEDMVSFQFTQDDYGKVMLFSIILLASILKRQQMEHWPGIVSLCTTPPGC
jgi:hypothetical protein